MRYYPLFDYADSKCPPGTLLYEWMQNETVRQLNALKRQNLIDSFTFASEEKVNIRLSTYRISGPFSKVRHGLCNLRAGTWVARDQLGQGVVAPRSKWVDYYIRLKLEREAGRVELSFSTQGLAAHANRIGQVEPVTLQGGDGLRRERFFCNVKNMMEQLKPVLKSHKDDYERRLKRHQRANGIARTPVGMN